MTVFKDLQWVFNFLIFYFLFYYFSQGTLFMTVESRQLTVLKCRLDGATPTLQPCTSFDGPIALTCDQSSEDVV
ncbi:hypothetical protein BDW42DRAFT_28451 [Aspergillus taichungensis]|uniref:Uncharacterized protein n=1 Tax=Aspergillus taichungensis TaxID=482145 RepID=A0A2J5HG73_9EURO|nr:hypothetical protein BDW42DRAFT_28451 [Aspergillus taichungensis]